jgi:cellulose biosynthesis protein BcsQ
MTATTITVDRLLELAKNALVGPSTPMIEELLDFGIDVLAGLKVINPYSLMKKISQGMVNEERGLRVMRRCNNDKKGDNIIISTPPSVCPYTFISLILSSFMIECRDLALNHLSGGSWDFNGTGLTSP